VLVERRAVQPIYVIDPDRVSMPFEIRAMEAIRAGLNERGAGDRLAPTQIFVRTHFPTPSHLDELYRSIAREVHVGEQYLWLAGLGEARGWSGVELSMTRFENAPPLQRLIFTADGRLNESRAAQLFRYWTFPLLDVAKEEMAREAERHGFIDLLLQRWFCFRPVLAKPCGRCRPCRLAYRGGVEFANPALALVVEKGRRARAAGTRRTARKAVGRTLTSLR
jgi:hypothetical protein